MGRLIDRSNWLHSEVDGLETFWFGSGSNWPSCFGTLSFLTSCFGSGSKFDSAVDGSFLYRYGIHMPVYILSPARSSNCLCWKISTFWTGPSPVSVFSPSMGRIRWRNLGFGKLIQFIRTCIRFCLHFFSSLVELRSRFYLQRWQISALWLLHQTHLNYFEIIFCLDYL